MVHVIPCLFLREEKFQEVRQRFFLNCFFHKLSIVLYEKIITVVLFMIQNLNCIIKLRPASPVEWFCNYANYKHRNTLTYRLCCLWYNMIDITIYRFKFLNFWFIFERIKQSYICIIYLACCFNNSIWVFLFKNLNYKNK